ncbi:hypothetical protein BGZ81_007633 [Podila clonocystis]|nr:hypothetical protein BGZ81_007633 [Podila clonocystis]
MISVKDQIKAMNSTLAGRKNAKEDATHLIRDETDQARQVLTVQDRKALYLLKCENCEYVIQGKPVKISIENCKNIVIKIEDKVITGMVDIWKSENISLDFERSVSVFQLDNIKTIAIRLPTHEHFGSMVWTGVDDISLHCGDQTHNLSYSQLQTRHPDLRPEMDQFKTTFVDGLPRTEAVVRLENGYPATRSEEASFRELEKKKDEVLRGLPDQDD